jgi:hypothetical protein
VDISISNLNYHRYLWRLVIVLAALALLVTGCRPVTAEWPTYTHGGLGITFAYPPGWTVEASDLATLLATRSPEQILNWWEHHTIRMQGPSQGCEYGDTIDIALQPYTLASLSNLQDYVDLSHQEWYLDSPFGNETLHYAIPVPPDVMPAGADWIFISAVEHQFFYVYTIWIVRDEMVYAISYRSLNYFAGEDRLNPELENRLHRIAASMRFDPAALAALRAAGIFWGDENRIYGQLPVTLTNPDVAICDFTCWQADAAQHLLAASREEAAAQLGISLEPTATPPTPASAMTYASPNADHLVRYFGYTTYGERFPGFEVWYDPQLWEFGERQEYNQPELVNRQEPACVLNLRGDPGARPFLGCAGLAGQRWRVFLSHDKYLSYSTTADRITYIFGIALPDSYAREQPSVCQQMAEDVIDTFVIAEKPEERSDQ